MYMSEHRHAKAGKIKGAGTRQVLRIDECCYIPTGNLPFSFQTNLEDKENGRVVNKICASKGEDSFTTVQGTLCQDIWK